MTKREIFESIINYVDTGVFTTTATDEQEAQLIDLNELKAFAEKEIVALDKKNEKARKRAAAAKKAEADAMTDVVLSVLSDDTFENINMITARVSEVDAEATMGKVRNRLARLVKSGDAVKETIKETGEDGKSRNVMGYRRATEVASAE